MTVTVLVTLYCLTIGLTYDRAGFTYKSLRNHVQRNYVFSSQGGAYAPYAPCMSTPLDTVLIKNVHTYEFHGFVWPNTQFQTLSIHDSCCTNSWKQLQTRSTDPWQGHTNFGHPVAVVLAMSDGMDDLEVAFQCDDYETQLFCYHTNCYQCQTFKDHTPYLAENLVFILMVDHV